MDKWLYFLMSIGTIFIMISPTTDDKFTFMGMGLFLVVVSVLVLIVKKKK